MTGEHGVVLREHYYDKLLNEKKPMTIMCNGMPYEGSTPAIDTEEVHMPLKRINNGKAIGSDEIPVEVWDCFGEEGAVMLLDLLRNL